MIEIMKLPILTLTQEQVDSLKPLIMITEQEYKDAIKLIQNYRNQIIEEVETLDGSQRIQDSLLSVRAKNVLENYRVKTISDLLHYEPEELLKFRYLGKKTQKEIIEFCKDYKEGHFERCFNKKQLL